MLWAMPFICLHLQEAERKLDQSTRDRQRHLAELTNLRAALRDAMGRSEPAVLVGKLHEQLDHAFAKEVGDLARLCVKEGCREGCDLRMWLICFLVVAEVSLSDHACLWCGT